MNKIQKIFLPKYKYNILEFIEQNADKINFYRSLSIFAYDYKYEIKTPLGTICAKSKTSVRGREKSFDFVQYNQMGHVTNLKSEYLTSFAERVFFNMHNTYEKVQAQNKIKGK